MTRWLDAAKGRVTPLTELTKPTEPQGQPHAVGVLLVKSILSGGGEVRAEALTAAEHDLLDAWHERAAIREYDGGMERRDAARAAAVDVGLAGERTAAAICADVGNADKALCPAHAS